MPSSAFSDNAWFSGFADGEGSFGIYPTYRPHGGYTPRFALHIRADDLPVLEELRAEFGGSIRFRCTQAERGEGRPQAYWTVNGKADLARLVAYFDRFPLRAKKQRDYAIWRHAVQVYLANGYRARELPALYEAIVAVRDYEAPDALAPEAIPESIA
jgi:hypothetical protein